jgi:hypothetical protein
MGDADADLARRAWRAMSDLVLDQNRKAAVSEALGRQHRRQARAGAPRPAATLGRWRHHRLATGR